MNNSKQTVTVKVCLGSACFSRGNGILIEALQEAIAGLEIKDQVDLSGLLCENKCKEGPTVIIDGETYCRLDKDSILAILSRKLSRKTISS